MNTEILELQRDLLLEQLLEVENQMYNQGVKQNKKGYTLFLRNGVFYVKYTDLTTGKQIPTNRSLETADRDEAEILAKKYRDSFIRSYYDKKNKIKDITAFFRDYYKPEKSQLFKEVLDKQRRKISKPVIRHYDGFVNNYFIPFLVENKIKRLNEIKITTMVLFQTYLFEKEKNGKKVFVPGTINDRIDGAIKPIFNNLLLKGIIKDMPFPEKGKFNLPESKSRKRRHTLQIYETMAVLLDQDIWKLFKTKEDIKNNKIANPKHYKKYRLLSLLIATCGLRDSEIFYLRKENIIKIRRTWFFDIVNSHNPKEEPGLKTENSKRKVPIPAITLQALNEYIAENNITDYLFYSGSKGVHYNMFTYTCYQFGAHCGYSEKELKEEKDFDFYGLRHFYKTALSRSNIKDDIIEYFVGHAVDPRKMDENYNKIEDLDDIFFEENGIKIIEYFNSLFDKVISKYELLPAHTRIEQVSLTDNKKNVKTYFTNVLNDIDFENETYLYICDLQEKGLLPNTNNQQELINGLKQLFENANIDKRRYDDCIYYVKNMEDEE
jgi:integrase